MTWNQNISPDRREAIARAGRALVRLAVDPEATEPAHRQNDIVNDVGQFTDRDAWNAVCALEYMVAMRDLMTPEEIEAERRVRRSSPSR